MPVPFQDEQASKELLAVKAQIRGVVEEMMPEARLGKAQERIEGLESVLAAAVEWRNWHKKQNREQDIPEYRLKEAIRVYLKFTGE